MLYCQPYSNSKILVKSMKLSSKMIISTSRANNCIEYRNECRLIWFDHAFQIAKIKDLLGRTVNYHRGHVWIVNWAKNVSNVNCPTIVYIIYPVMQKWLESSLNWVETVVFMHIELLGDLWIVSIHGEISSARQRSASSPRFSLRNFC